MALLYGEEFRSIGKMTDFVYQGEDFDEKVRKQVEFYFSDSNLQTDKFLWRIYESNDGWVELKTILTFGRMRQYRPEDKVIAALKQSDKLVLSTNEDMIRRKDPLKDFNELKNIRKRNSVHIEGLPKEASQEELEDFFDKKVAGHLPKDKSICSVRRIRSRVKKEFFGVIDVEFNSQEDADFFLNKLEIVYPQGVVGEDSDIDKKDYLKKMSLLTFQEMKEGGKRFGVNDVTKRRNSFNEARSNKKQRKSFNGKRPKLSKGSGGESGKEDSGAQPGAKPADDTAATDGQTQEECAVSSGDSEKESKQDLKECSNDGAKEESSKKDNEEQIDKTEKND